MKTKRELPFTLRAEYADTCAKCGTHQSVKYDVGDETWCNVCVFKHLVAVNLPKTGD